MPSEVEETKSSGTKVKFVTLASLAFVLIIIALVVFLFRLKEEKHHSNYYQSDLSKLVFSDKISRSTIYDRDENALCVDETLNILVFNKSNFISFKSDVEKKSICNKIEKVLHDFGIQTPVSFVLSKINSYKGSSIPIAYVESSDEQIIKDRIENDRLENFLSFSKVKKRRIKEVDFPKSARRFVGKLEDKRRVGKNGVEKLLNKYISAPIGLQNDDSTGHDIYLTISLSLINQIDQICTDYHKSLSKKTHVIVHNLRNYELLALWDNESEDAIFDDEVYNFPSIKSSKISASRIPYVLTMIETDPTLLDPYYCNGADCDAVHGEVGLYNLINCKAGFSKAFNIYKDSGLRPILEESYHKHLLPKIKNDVLTARDLLLLLFMAFGSDKVPILYDNDMLFDDGVVPKEKIYPDNYILEIKDVPDEEYRVDGGSALDSQSVEFSEKGKNYLKKIFTDNICKQVYGFSTKTGLLVLLYQEDGVDMDFAKRLRDNLDNFEIEAPL